MKTIKNLEKAIEITINLLDDITFMCETRTKSTYFTRNGKMGFKILLLFALNFVKKTLQIELDSFFKNIEKSGELNITKQGYSQARKKISPIAFIKMADAIIKWFYEDDDFKTFKGYRLTAIDGSVIKLNNSKKLRKAYGYAKNKSVKVARALASALYDVENDMIITSKITRYDSSERDIAIELIEKLKKLGLKNDLILFDRGYPSSKLISYLENNQIKYLMRVSSSFLKSINEAQEEDQVVKVNINGESIKVRVLRFMLDSGEEEILITNLFDEDLTVEDFKELYFKRWGIETKYDELKNRLQIENFTGTTPITIEQDFYASIYLGNMVAIAKTEANQKIKEKNKDKNLKYEYKVNTNILIGKLKDSLVAVFLEENPQKRATMLNKIKEEISKNTIPIRSGRSNKRKKKRNPNKYAINRKSGL